MPEMKMHEYYPELCVDEKFDDEIWLKWGWGDGVITIGFWYVVYLLIFFKLILIWGFGWAVARLIDVRDTIHIIK